MTKIKHVFFLKYGCLPLLSLTCFLLCRWPWSTFKVPSSFKRGERVYFSILIANQQGICCCCFQKLRQFSFRNGVYVSNRQSICCCFQKIRQFSFRNSMYVSNRQGICCCCFHMIRQFSVRNSMYVSSQQGVCFCCFHKLRQFSFRKVMYVSSSLTSQ